MSSQPKAPRITAKYIEKSDLSSTEKQDDELTNLVIHDEHGNERTIPKVSNEHTMNASQFVGFMNEFAVKNEYLAETQLSFGDVYELVPIERNGTAAAVRLSYSTPRSRATSRACTRQS